MRCCFFFCTAEVNDDHPTSENGKLAAFASGRPAFQQHVKRAEGSDTIPTAHVQKALSAGRKAINFDRNGKDHAAQRGRDASRLLSYWGSRHQAGPRIKQGAGGLYS